MGIPQMIKEAFIDTVIFGRGCFSMKPEFFCLIQKIPVGHMEIKKRSYDIEAKYMQYMYCKKLFNVKLTRLVIRQTNR